MLKPSYPAQVLPPCLGHHLLSHSLPLRMSTVLAMLVEDQEEVLEIDPERGPIVITSTGETSFFELKNYFRGKNAVRMPQKLWKDCTSTERKVIAYMAAKATQNLKRSAEPKLVQAIAEREEAVLAKKLALEEASKLKAIEDSHILTTAERCQRERERPPISWRPISFDMVTANHDKKAPGMFYGLVFPFSAPMLKEFGPEWLTLAFHTAGTLERSNRITRISISDFKITAGNNAGKFLFEVKYQHNRPGLHRKLFAKVPFAMTKETKQDRLSSSVLKQPMDFCEVNTYRLVESAMPMRMPKFYFGDVSNETSNYLLIMERIAFVGLDGCSKDQALKPFEIEGPYDKCKDWELKGNPKEYYSMIMEVTAKIAAADKSGDLGSPEFVGLSFAGPPAPLDQPHLWGMDPNASSGGPPAVSMSRLKLAIDFFSDIAKVVFPPYAPHEAFIAKFTRTMMTFLAYSREIEYWKHMDLNYVALSHANLNVDNAFFWRDRQGKLDCGALDWGGFGTGCLGHKIWWYLMCCEWEDLDRNLGHYLETFLTVYHKGGGPVLDLEVLMMMVKLTCLGNLSFLVAAVPDSLKQCPKQEWLTITSRHDPRIAADVGGKSTLRTALRSMDNDLRMIEEFQTDVVLERWITEIWEGKMGQARKTDEMIFGVPQV